MRQYFFRDAIDLYNLTFLRTMLRQSTKREADAQVASVLFFRKCRRLLKHTMTESEYFWEVSGHMDEFYDQRHSQISGTFADLCLQYDVAARVIFDSLAREDMELYRLLHDNQHFVRMLGSVHLSRAQEFESQTTQAIAMLKAQGEQLLEFDAEILEGAAEREWVLYLANLLHAYHPQKNLE